MRKYSSIIVIMTLLFLVSIVIIHTTMASSLPLRLDVPTFVQHYEPWKDQQYGFGNRTIEYAGCALTSLSMLLKYNDIDTDPEDLNNWLKQNNGFEGKESIRWSRVNQKSNGKLTYVQSTNFNGIADIRKIKLEIDSGNPVIAKMNYKNTNHFVLICGYEDNTFFINDPWTEDSSKTINLGYEPYNSPEKSIKGIVLFRSNNANKTFVPVVKVASSKFSQPIKDDFLPVVSFPEITLTIDNPYMKIGNKQKEIDPNLGTTPIIIKNRTFLPIRAIVEAMGGTISWDGSTKKVEIDIAKRTIEMWVDKRQAFINGYPFTLESPPVIKNGRSLLPLRVIIEKLHGSISWDAETKSVSIK